MNPPFEILTKVNLDDLVNAFGWKGKPALEGLLRFLFLKPAQQFAKQMLEFDSDIERKGLISASRSAQRYYVKDVRVFHADRIPDSAFLALSNHPGMTDTLSLFCALKRNDLKIIALDRPFLTSLPNISKQLFYVTDDPNKRVTLVRQVSGHLRSGQAVLTFPAGHTEPDPDIYAGAVDSLQTWTDSVGVFVRLAPETAILPVLVRNVIWDKAANHLLTKLKRTKDERELFAVALQLLSNLLSSKKYVIAKVQIGRPIYVKELGTTDTQVIHQAVLAEMKSLIENPPIGEGVSVL